jgi:hypothetical protein
VRELPSSDLKSEPPGPGTEAAVRVVVSALRVPVTDAGDADAEADLDRAFERGSMPPPAFQTSTPPPVPEAALRKRAASHELAEDDGPPHADAFASTQLHMDAPIVAPVASAVAADELPADLTAAVLAVALPIAPAAVVIAPVAKSPAATQPVKTQPVASLAKPAPVAVTEHAAAALWQRVLFFLAVVAVGYGGYSALQRIPRTERSDSVASDSSGAQDDVVVNDALAPVETPAVESPPQAKTIALPAVPPSPTVLSPGVTERDVGFGRVLPYIDQSRGTAVREGEGLLVVEVNPEGSKARIRIGDRDLGTAPVSAALPAGRHEVIFQRGDESSFRYLVIRAGETRIVQVP